MHGARLKLIFISAAVRCQRKQSLILRANRSHNAIVIKLNRICNALSWASTTYLIALIQTKHYSLTYYVLFLIS